MGQNVRCRQRPRCSAHDTVLFDTAISHPRPQLRRRRWVMLEPVGDLLRTPDQLTTMKFGIHSLLFSETFIERDLPLHGFESR